MTTMLATNATAAHYEYCTVVVSTGYRAYSNLFSLTNSNNPTCATGLDSLYIYLVYPFQATCRPGRKLVLYLTVDQTRMIRVVWLKLVER